MSDKKKKELTERQKVFLDALFGESKGNIRQAMRVAGYSDATTIMEAIGPIKEHVVEAATTTLALHGPLAVYGMIDVLNDPASLGAKTKVAAAKELLDRAGIVKTEKVEVEGPKGGLFVLPPKQETNE